MGRSVVALVLALLAHHAAAVTIQECLLGALATSSDDMTVAEIKAQCAGLQDFSELVPEAIGQSGDVVGPAAPGQGSLTAVPAASATSPAAPPLEEIGVADLRRAQEKKVENLAFVISPHRPNYLLMTYNSKTNAGTWDQVYPDTRLDDEELKFQISLQAPIRNDIPVIQADLYAAYSQVSWWQILNDDESSPFRETNYEPEIFLRWDTDFKLLGFTSRLVDIGFNHQSNGKGEPLSRSWNRLYATAVVERGSLAFTSRFWWRIPEHNENDDNPDITEYMGNGEITSAYKWRQQVFALTMRNNLSSDNKGAAQLDWTFPLGKRFKGHIQYFDGYGESLVDYNAETRRIGFGVLITDWF